MDAHTRKKGAWTIIFFLVSFYAVMGVADITMLSQGDITLRTTQGVATKAATNTADKESFADNSQSSITLQHFRLDTQLREGELIVEVSNRLLEKESVALETIRARFYDQDQWHTANISVHQWNKMTTVEITPLLSTTYYVSGQKNSAPSSRRLTDKQLFYWFVGITGVLLLIAHAKPPKISVEKKKKENKKLIELEEHIRVMIKKGVNDERIRRDLLSVGWDEELVDEALKKVRYF